MQQATDIQQPNHKGNWFFRHKIVTSFLIILFLFSCVGVFHHSPSKAEVQGISTSLPTDTASSLPTATATPTDTPTPTATPTPTIVIKLVQPTIQPTQPPTTQDQGLSNNNYYINSSGNEVHSPADSDNGSVPAGATAKCADGTYSFSQHHSGTCSSHGGVVQWL